MQDAIVWRFTWRLALPGIVSPTLAPGHHKAPDTNRIVRARFACSTKHEAHFVQRGKLEICTLSIFSASNQMCIASTVANLLPTALIQTLGEVLLFINFGNLLSVPNVTEVPLLTTIGQEARTKHRDTLAALIANAEIKDTVGAIFT